MDGHVRGTVTNAALPSDGTVVVVGASLAGWRAVETLRREGFHGGITLVGEELHLPYDRPPLSKQVLAGKWPPEKAVLADRKLPSSSWPAWPEIKLTEHGSSISAHSWLPVRILVHRRTTILGSRRDW